MEKRSPPAAVCRTRRSGPPGKDQGGCEQRHLPDRHDDQLDVAAQPSGAMWPIPGIRDRVHPVPACVASRRSRSRSLRSRRTTDRSRRGNTPHRTGPVRPGSPSPRIQPMRPRVSGRHRRPRAQRLPEDQRPPSQPTASRSPSASVRSPRRATPAPSSRRCRRPVQRLQSRPADPVST